MYSEEELNNMSLEELKALEKKLKGGLKPKKEKKPKTKAEAKSTTIKKPRKKKEILLEELVPDVDESEDKTETKKRLPRLSSSHGDEPASREKLKLGPRPNKFLQMPEAKSKNTDKQFDKKMWKNLEPVERGVRATEELETRCAGCGKKITVPASLVVKGTRYKCNKCASMPGTGGEGNFGDDDED